MRKKLNIDVSDWYKPEKRLPDYDSEVLVIWESAGTLGLDFARFENGYWNNKHGKHCPKNRIKYWAVPPCVVKQEIVERGETNETDH